MLIVAVPGVASCKEDKKEMDLKDMLYLRKKYWVYVPTGLVHRKHLALQFFVGRGLWLKSVPHQH